MKTETVLRKTGFAFREMFEGYSALEILPRVRLREGVLTKLVSRMARGYAVASPHMNKGSERLCVPAPHPQALPVVLGLYVRFLAVQLKKSTCCTEQVPASEHLLYSHSFVSARN